MENINGSTRPVPTPCSARPTSTSANPDAKPLITAPTMKAHSANNVMERAENHLLSKLEKGMIRPMTSIYPTTSHCVKEMSTPSCAEIDGSAMFSAVSEYMPVKPPRYNPIIAKYGCLTCMRALGDS